MKKTSLFVLLMLITILAAGRASFAACSSTFSLANGSGVWALQAYGAIGVGTATPTLDNLLIQGLFITGGTFTGTEWQSLNGTLSSFSISGTWSMTTPVKDCQGTIIVTSSSSNPTQTFTFAINDSSIGGAVTQIDTTYTMAGIMVYQGPTTFSCSSTTFKNKQYSLYSNGTIPAAGGLVTGSGEILFAKTGTTFSSAPTVTLDLGAAGNFVVPATGTATVSSNCQGSGSLVVSALSETFDVDFVIVNSGKEALWIVTNTGDNVTGYFLE